MSRGFVKGQIYKDADGYEWEITDKQGLVDKIWSMPLGGFDFATGKDEEFDIYETIYRAEQYDFCDSEVVLIGGYGGYTISAYKPTHKEIEDLVHQFYNAFSLHRDEFVFIRKEK
ncbi:MAG: hypothetical protein PHE79_09615 [Eubacteriales bacterium]|nr:hypothetical protein [Eubacteriales bacterium]